MARVPSLQVLFIPTPNPPVRQPLDPPCGKGRAQDVATEPLQATVDPVRVREYLLSATHPIGRFKATFFAVLGFAPDRWELLRDALLHAARTGDAIEGQASEFGIKYELRGLLTGPNGRSAAVVTIWIVHHGQREPRFVTAFPG